MLLCYYGNNVPSRLSPQWLCGKSCTWAHDVRLIYIYIYIHTHITLEYIIVQSANKISCDSLSNLKS